MNETELRAEVAKVRNVPDNTWDFMRGEGYVGEAVGGFGEAEDDPVGYLVRKFDRISDAAPTRGGLRRPKGRTSEGERIPPQLTDYEIEKSELFSEYLAKLAASGSEVKGFRLKYLGDKLLAPRQAWALLTSPVAAHWSLRLHFEPHAVPVVGHTYQVTEGMSDESGPYSLVEVPLPTSSVASFKDRRPLRAGMWELPDKRENARSNERPMRVLKPWKVVPYPGEDGQTHRVLVKPKTVLGDLHDKVNRLIRHYPWEEADATWFVLTGGTPWMAPLTWQFRGTGPGSTSWSYGYITLKVEPWISVNVVERVYSDLQRKLLGKDNKQVGEKNRELFRFVTDRIKTDGSLPKARELVKEWDGSNPQWRYGHDDTDQVRRFRRDYNLARRLLAAFRYELPEE